MRNEEVLHRVKEERNILRKIKAGKTNWSGYTLCRNDLLKHIVEGDIDGRMAGAGRRERRRKQLMGGLKKTRGYRKLKEEALDRTMWRTHFGSAYAPVLRQTEE